MSGRDYIMVQVIDMEDGSPKTLTLRRRQAERIGLIKSEKTVLDDIVESLNEDCICPSCQWDPPGLCKPVCVCPCHA